MAITNTIRTVGVNEEFLFSLAITDTVEHDLPDVDGDDSAGGDGFDVRGTEAWTFKLVNTHDQSATVRLEGATQEDGSFAEPDSIVSGVSVAASGGTESIQMTEEHARARIVVSYATAPTGTAGNEFKVVASGGSE